MLPNEPPKTFVGLSNKINLKLGIIGHLKTHVAKKISSHLVIARRSIIKKIEKFRKFCKMEPYSGSIQFSLKKISLTITFDLWH